MKHSLASARLAGVNGAEVASTFELGEPLGPPVEAARGWGGHNVVHRLQTSAGFWAVKSLVRELDDLLVERFEIEMTAWRSGVPMPRPAPARNGAPCAVIGGRLVRCHEWVNGTAKVNEETTAEEASTMGSLVARLHQLAIPWSAQFDRQLDPSGRPTWAELAEDGLRREARWATVLADNLVEMERMAEAAQRLRDEQRQTSRIGSHRDLNAHNVLFSPDGLSLIDWDAAGPAFPPWERADYATLWSARKGGYYDPDAVYAFLRGYLDAGGEVTHDDPDTLAQLLETVESWTKKNVSWANSAPSDEYDLHAELLIEALLATPRDIEERRRLLSAAISRLLRR